MSLLKDIGNSIGSVVNKVGDTVGDALKGAKESGVLAAVGGTIANLVIPGSGNIVANILGASNSVSNVTAGAGATGNTGVAGGSVNYSVNPQGSLVPNHPVIGGTSASLPPAPTGWKKFTNWFTGEGKDKWYKAGWVLIVPILITLGVICYFIFRKKKNNSYAKRK